MDAPHMVLEAMGTTNASPVAVASELTAQVACLEAELVELGAAQPRKSYASASPITKTSGKHGMVLARFARNRRLPTPATVGLCRH
jgi:hypothetical protein